MGNIYQVAGKFEDILALILPLKQLGYDDFNLYYEDSDIWVLKWHNPTFRLSQMGFSWRGIRYERTFYLYF